jgi:DNA-binding CsgD family transcriptional regulator/tetratricopeptide (TPR) repeat protein
MSSPTIIGRDTELEKLEAAWRVTVAGEPQLILVAGEAGIGKTRLAKEFADRVTRSGGRVFSGACIDLRQGGLPYAPIRQALRTVTRSADVRHLIETVGDGLAPLLPDLGASATVTVLGDQARRVRLFESLLHLFQELASRAPVLLVVDDVQWADQGTLDLLTFLARNLAGVPILELLAFRDDRLALDDPLWGFLVGQGSGTVRDRLTLGRLDQRHVAAQIAGIVETEPDPRLVEAVFERSDGNPFFVEELLAASEGHRSPVPPTVRELLLSRILHLPAAIRQVLRLAAVAGRTVSQDTLARVANMKDLELSDALRAAIDAQVLEPVEDEDGFTFRHTLLREALYDDLLPSERRRMHRAYASVLEAGQQRESSAMGAVANHHDLGGEPERALPAFITAATAAERSFAFADAERFLRRAVELWDLVPDPSGMLGMDKVTLLSRAVEAALAVEDTKRALPLAQDALRLVDAQRDPTRAGLLLVLLGRALLLDGQEQEAHDAHDKAVRTVPAVPASRERAEVLAYRANLLALAGRFREARALGEEAIQVARSAGTVAEECRPLLTTGSVIARLGDRTAGLQLIDDGEMIARKHDLAVELMRVYIHRGRALQAYAAWEKAWHNYVRGATEAPKFGMARRYLWRFQVLAARMLFWLGRWAESRTTLSEAREQGGAKATLPSLLIATGQWDAAKEWFAQPQSRWRSDGAGVLQQPEAQVELATWLGDYDDALDYCAEGLTLVARSEDPLPAARLCVAGLRAHADRAQAVGLAARPPASAVQLRDRLEDLAMIHPARPDGFGQQLAALAHTGMAEFSRLRGNGDLELWQQTVDAWTEVAMPYPAAYARFRHAERLLVAAEDRVEAARQLGEAYTVAKELAAEPLQQAISACASRGGLNLNLKSTTAGENADQQDGWGLTPRERQVLGLLVDGYSNRRIGRALFIAESTASVHVSRILRKLGVHNRGEAIAYVLRQQQQDD